MNLELLDPFRRQIPDRVDATLELPTVLHFRKKGGDTGENGGANKTNDDDDGDEWKAANHVAFNRRGAYIAIGYGSGTVGVFDVLSRSLTGLYRSGGGDDSDVSSHPNSTTTTMTTTTSPSPTANTTTTTTTSTAGHGVTSVSWSRRSRTLLAGSAGDAEIRLIDTTHPFGPEQCCLGIVASEDKPMEADDERSNSGAEVTENQQPKESSFSKTTQKTSNSNSTTTNTNTNPDDHHKKPRQLEVKDMATINVATPTPSKTTKGPRRQRNVHVPVSKTTKRRYPSVVFHLPIPVGSSLQIHPRDVSAGLAQMDDGSLIAFWVPSSGWDDDQGGDTPEPEVKIATVFKSSSHFITCAAFDPHGDRIYAATKEGKLLGFECGHVFDAFASDANDEIPRLKANFTIHIPGGATVWHMIVSRNGRYLVLNSADASIRLYQTKECWTTPEEVDKPTWVFQDVVSKVKFASCDISGDSEFVVGGANGETDNKYELYIWNTSTGALMDKLTGATVELFSVAWHPTRSFLAVAASDGLVDIWGPRINWTAFAPDFQALPQNVEYVECEDEFDIVDEDSDVEPKKDEDEDEEKEAVDILTVEPVPVFASDSEDEDDVFCFETKVTRLLGAITT
jgi:WD40 repeat protein